MAKHDDFDGQMIEPTAHTNACQSDTGTADTEPDVAADIEVEFDDPTDVDAVDDRKEEVDERDSQKLPRATLRMSPLRLAAGIGLTMAVAVAGLSGWLGYRAYQSHLAEREYQLMLHVGRQGAVNLTTIDHAHAEADVQRILDASTGAFESDFSARSQPFIDTVKKLQSKSVGTVTDAGIESVSGDEAQVLVAMSVKTTIGNQPEQEPRSWRMRISVQKVGNDDAKVSNVAFVP